jgi:hypothetical protein
MVDKEKRIDIVAFDNCEDTYLDKKKNTLLPMSIRSKHRNQYVLWLETGIDSDDKELKRHVSSVYKNFQMYEEFNTCVNFVSSLPEDQSCQK